MAYDILPEENLHFSDIRDCLNSAGGSVTNDVASAFKTTAKIHMWTKNKPINSSKEFDITDTDRANANHNFIVIYKDGYAPNEVYWRYATPTAPFRLGDFRGYNRKALPPIYMATISSNTWNLYYTSDPDIRLVASFKYDGTIYHGTGIEIDINEVKSGVSESTMNYGVNMSDLYLCVAEGENSCCIAGYALKEGNNGGIIESIKGSSLYTSLKNKGVGTYPLYIFLTSSPMYINRTFPLPNVKMSGTNVVTEDTLPTIDFSIKKDFWLKFSITSCILSISGKTIATLNAGETAVLSDADTILTYPDTQTLTLTYNIRTRRKEDGTEKKVDIDLFTIKSTLHPSDVEKANIDVIRIANYFINNENIIDIQKTLVPNTDPIYELDRYSDSTSEYYNIVYTVNTTVKQLKSIITGLKQAGNDAVANFNTTFFSNSYEIPNEELYYDQQALKFKI